LKILRCMVYFAQSGLLEDTERNQIKEARRVFSAEFKQEAVALVVDRPVG
jgi:hypothetical protein